MSDGDETQVASVKTLGRYYLVRRIGKGGMGEVWLGQDPRLQRQVAIKTLPLHNQSDREYVQRFEREARAAAALNHPHILPIHDYGEQTLSDGQAITYIVMPYVPGGTLNERIRQLTANGQLLPQNEALHYLFQAAEAIDYAHSQHVLHRDIKPGNMLLRSDNWLLLADFGIARILSDTEQLTQAGSGIGTPEYMAPEQAQGRPEAASDNYSLAVIAYQLFTGKIPFKAETPYATTIQHIITPPPPPREINPNLSPAVEQALLHGLAKDPGQRPPSAHAFVAELQYALQNGMFVPMLNPQTPASVGVSDAPTVVTNRPVTPPLIPGAPGGEQTQVSPGITRRQLLIGGGAAALLVGGGLAAWAITSKLTSSAPAVATATPRPTRNPNLPLMTLNAHTQPISSLAWSPTAAHTLVSAGKDSEVMLWDIAALQQGQGSSTAPKAKLQLGSATVNSLLLAWSADGQSLAIANAVFALNANPQLADMKMQIYKSDLSSLVPYYNDNYMTFRRTAYVSAVIWGPGQQIIAITRPYELAGKTKYLLEFRDPLAKQPQLNTITQFGFGYSLALTPDGSTLALGSYDGVLIGQPVVAGRTARWKTSPTTLVFDGTPPLTSQGGYPPAGDVTWSPDARYVAGITNSLFVPKYLRSQIAVWDVQQGQSSRLSLSIPRSDEILTRLAWSPASTSTLLAAGTKDGSVHIWSVNPKVLQGNALPTRTLTGIKDAAVTALAWSSDGQYLAAGFNDTQDSLLIWKL